MPGIEEELAEAFIHSACHWVVAHPEIRPSVRADVVVAAIIDWERTLHAPAPTP